MNSATPTATAGFDATTGDDRTFFVDGLREGQTYRITVVNCNNVFGDGRNATFTAENVVTDGQNNTVANTGSPAADIVRVNGVRTTETAANAAVTGLQIPTTTFVADDVSASFIIDGDGVECILPVVYFDSSTEDTTKGGNVQRLELVSGLNGTPQRPLEEFDTGGRTKFTS